MRPAGGFGRGGRINYAFGMRVATMEFAARPLGSPIPEDIGTGRCGVSPDGLLSARRTRGSRHCRKRESVHASVCRGVAIDRRRGSSNIAFHPSGDWVVVGGETLGLIYICRGSIRAGRLCSSAKSELPLSIWVRMLSSHASVTHPRHRCTQAGAWNVLTSDAMMARHEQKLEQSKKGKMTAEKSWNSSKSRQGERMEGMRPMLEKQIRGLDFWASSAVKRRGVKSPSRQRPTNPCVLPDSAAMGSGSGAERAPACVCIAGNRCRDRPAPPCRHRPGNSSCPIRRWWRVAAASEPSQKKPTRRPSSSAAPTAFSIASTCNRVPLASWRNFQDWRQCSGWQCRMTAPRWESKERGRRNARQDRRTCA